jgi:hypothetical protein
MTSPPPLTREVLQQSLTGLFAPWVQALNLQVESWGPGEIDVRGADDGKSVCRTSTACALQ